MAHSCPICDQHCHCGGDIDDVQIDGTEEQMNCCHCFDEGDYDEIDFDDQYERNNPNDSRNL